VQWNKETGNPYLRYKSDGDQHTIWFLDAATFYNQMKVAIDNGSKGIAVWRLGSEDPSIWKLLNHSSEMKNPAPVLKKLVNPDPVHYSGQGEVLKIVSSAKDGNRSIQTDNNGFISNETYDDFPKPFEVVRYGKPKDKEVALTFDDGPDPVYTQQILDILDRYHIKGSFFIVGENAELHPEIIKREFNDGDEIGNHTFSHPDVASVSPMRTKMELNANQRLFEEITGHSMTMFRAPYAAVAEPSTPNEILPILRAQSMGYTMIGELIDPEDWQRPGTDEIVKRVLKQLPNGNVILLHDAGGDRSQTVAALPKIIEELQKQGYSFTTISHLIGKSSADIMPSATKDKSYLVYDKAVFSVLKGWREGISIIFYSAIILGLIRLAFLVFLSRRQVKRYKEIPFDPDFTPLVSVVIAAFNEEKVICQTIDSILTSDYPAFEIIVVDDGSKDCTSQVVEEAFKQNSQVRLLRKVNGGKSSAINYGIKEASGEIIVALDADTIISHDAISLLVRHFKNEKVAAVSGNVKVGNKRNLLTNWQHIEYVTGFNLERRSFAQLNCITVVPGAIGAWRKTAVVEAGYFREDTLAEDTDLTLLLLELGYKIEFEEKAYAYTEAPEDMKSLAKQRYRWTYGTLQCLWKHKGKLFNKSHKTLGFIGMPNMWIYQYFYQVFSPIADLLFILALFGNHPKKAAIGFVVFYLVDFLTSLYAFRLEKESPKPLLSLFLQRILYKQLMTYVVFKSIFSALKGGTVGWNKLKRNGNVNKKAHAG
jgi:cellulose synthase/poly-beta-1,6-N-acetylglucosamine synthase-like glycosyltransferase/peptidoglycan/xylan/chitin deacetylase (PgdA/CDA1 family)